jgi:hypothetical protein
VRSRLGDLLEGDLAPRERAKVENHVRGCSDCAAELADLRGTVRLLRRLPDPEPPLHLASAVMARIADGEGRPSRIGRWVDSLLAPAAAAPLAAAAAALLLFAVVTELPGPAPDGPTAELARVAPPLPGAPSGAQGASPPRPGLFAAAPPERRIAGVQRDAVEARRAALGRARSSPAWRLAVSGQAEQAARLLRGAGHPHSSLLAAELHGDRSGRLSLASFSP